MQDLENIVSRAAAEFAAASDPASLENAKAKYLGKAGELTALLKQLGSLGPDEKKSFGQSINAAKQQIEAALDSRRKGLELKKLESRLTGEGAGCHAARPAAAGRGGVHPIKPHLAPHRGDLRLDRFSTSPTVRRSRPIWYNFYRAE